MEATSPVRLNLVATDGSARAGVLHTPHGEVATPVFMPVGTQATVKSLTPEQVADTGASIVLSNTYHLYLRPGVGVVEAAGGVHGFMQWNAPILTDSGGFQVFSLAGRRSITADGVRFRSHIDGSEHFFTPEGVMDYEQRLGADIAMAFDECAPYPAERSYVETAMERTHQWAVRCAASHTRADQALFGIVQGGVWPDLRRQSAEFLTQLDLPGYGIGGLSVGEDKQEMADALAAAADALPVDKPRYLMGVGAPDDLLDGVARGVDMFDCVLPTRNARNGALFTRHGRLNVRNGSYREDLGAIEEGCDCYTCSRFNRAYLSHLFRAEELLAYTLASIHNVRFLVRLMERARAAIVDGRFEAFRSTFLADYRPPDRASAEINRDRRRARAD